MEFDFINQFLDDDSDFEDIFKDFDFDLLDSSEFMEDAVREEIIYPLLMKLGYSASNKKNRIIRSKALKHPFYYFGTKKYNVNIIPDYTFEIDGENKWILDAKRPTENIDEGKNVFQAYSYAMHPEVQSEIYSLCNGKKIVIYNVKEHKPILSFEIKELKKNWKLLKKTLSPEFVQKPHIKDFHFDLGIFVLKVGDRESRTSPISFPLIRLNDLAKLENNLYSTNGVFKMKGMNKTFMGTFDFNEKQYQDLLELMPIELRTTIEYSLNHQPFRFGLDNSFDFPDIGLFVKAVLGSEIITNVNESYLPFNVITFHK